MRSFTRHIVVCALLLQYAAGAAAQTTPTPTTGEAAPAQTPADVPAAPLNPPADTAAPAPQPAPQAEPAPASSALPGILILPAEFTVFQRSTVALEPVPAWTEAAERNLAESAHHVLGADGRFRVMVVPELAADRQAELREHIELFKVIGSQLETVVKPGGKAWEGTRSAADYRVGSGLAFLKQQTGAQYAFLLAGAEVRQTGGSVFMQMMLAGLTGVYTPGGGTYMYAGVIDLETGKITWFGTQMGVQFFGMGAADARQASGAEAALAGLLKSYPRTVGLDLGSGTGR